MPDEPTISTDHAAPPTLRVDDPPKRIKRPSRTVAFIRGWMDEHMSREQVSAGLKTMLWVIPLTILIWIYAERQGHTTFSNVTLPVEIVSNDPTKVFSIISPASKNVVVTLKGPRVALEAAQKQFNPLNGSLAAQIQFDGSGSSAPQSIRTVRVREDKRLADANITVESAEPDEIRFYVDQLVEREYRVEVDDPRRFGTPPKFTPEVVKLRGPSRVLNNPTNSLRVEADLASAMTRVAPSDQPLELTDVKLNVVGADASSVKPIPERVSAVVTPIKAKEALLPRVRVMIAAPKAVLDRYQVELPGGETITNVAVSGPEDVINRLVENAPIAFVEVTQAVLSSGEAEVPIQYNLPPDVVLKDERRTLTVRAVMR